MGAALVGGDRAVSHGVDKRRNHHNIAALWNAYLSIRPEASAPLTPEDVSTMMGLLKIARTQYGAFNPDNYVDGSAYFAISGEIAAIERQ